MDFGINAFDHNNIIEKVHNLFENSSKLVRVQCSAIFLSIYKQSDSVLSDQMLNGLKSSACSDLEKQFRSVPVNQMLIPPTRRVPGVYSNQINSNDLIPRADLNELVSPQILKNLSDIKNWENRQWALQEIAKILSNCNGSISPEADNVMIALKDRISDSNNLLVRQNLEILSNIANYMGKPVKRYVKVIIPAIFNALSNSNKLTFDAAKNTAVT